MKKDKKLQRLEAYAGTYDLGECIFKYNKNVKYFYYITDYSEKLFMGIAECDFILDGFHIHRISDLKSIKCRNDINSAINKNNRILDDVSPPEIDLTSWKTVLKTLSKRNHFVIIENEYEDDYFFYLGKIKKVKKTEVIFTHYDADGSMHDNIVIPISEITSVVFGDRYSKTWEEYISKAFRFTYDT